MDAVLQAVGYGVVADVLVLLHLAFVLFVVFGGLLVLWHRPTAWLHVPAALYGAAIEFFGWTCPLTPLEIRFRRLAGEEGYTGGFIDHYVRGLLYPEQWMEIHVWLGVGVVALNLVVYLWIWRRS